MSHPCAWDGCEWPAFLHLPICVDHAFEVADTVRPDGNDTTQTAELGYRVARRRTAREARERAHADSLRQARGDQPGWIYYLCTDARIKIGYTANLDRRITEYNPGAEVLAVHPGTPALEKVMHQQFAAHLVDRREWFRDVQEIRDHCSQVVAQYGSPRQYARRTR